jgi:hypothetical protein
MFIDPRMHLGSTLPHVDLGHEFEATYAKPPTLDFGLKPEVI